MKIIDLNLRIQENIITTLKKYQGIAKAVIFGSRATRFNKKNSDIDLAIYCQSEFPVGLRLDLEEAVGIYKIDVVNMHTLTNEKLKKAIEKDGVEIYAGKTS
ncbi:MAG: nucleotidyltransferase domain-containing protein [Candidatus Margulisiibacteriota bacterium]|jgi:predicted nucleotidyltransferase